MPVLHAWYKSSPSGGVHQLLGLSSNEIDKVLSFVKYILVQEIKEADKKKIMTVVKADYEERLGQLKELYKEELGKAEDKKSQKNVNTLYQENIDEIDKEFNRIKSVLSDLDLGSTILESDYRNIFYKFADSLTFQSGPEALLKMLQGINVQKEIKARIKQYTQIKSEDQKKKIISLIKLLINLHVSDIKPENMVIRKLPVIPPDLRPVVQLE
ncbi:hypothetical protein KKG31_05955 [Patescibacteria group bacterium]|nr:hypothetical protein [Patescibacteria group bacterium]